MAIQLAKQLRHPKERTYGSIMIVIGTVVWLAVLAFLAYAVFRGSWGLLPVVIFYALLIWLSGLIIAAFFRARAFGHNVLITEQQCAHLHEMLVEGAGQLGLKTVPVAFIYNSSGVINAFARRMLGRPYVFLTSMLLDVDTDAQVRFVIGHELGHHAAGHLDWKKNLLKFPAHFVPFLPQAYSRGRELTADRIGAFLANDLHASRGALQMLACGSARLNPVLNHEAFAAQEAMVPGFFGWLLAIISYYPRTTQRVAALEGPRETTRERMAVQSVSAASA